MNLSLLQREPQFKTWSAIRAISTAFIPVFAGRLISTGFVFPALALLSGLGFMYPSQLNFLYQKFNRICRQAGINPALLLGAFFGICLSSTILVGLADPSHAQFFGTTENWLKSKLELDEKLVGLVFNTLRGIFVLYIGIAIVQVIQKGQQQEDWQTLARTPLIVVVAVTLGDALASLITGEGSSNANG